MTPLWPVFLAWKGLGPAQIGIVLSAAYIIKIVSNPIAGHISDQLGDRRLPLIVLAVIALIVQAQFAWADGFWLLLAITLIASGAYTALTPLADNLTLLAISGQKLHYGHVRVWGSIAFLVISGLATDLLIDEPPMLIVWTLLGGMALVIAACWWVPRVRGDRMTTAGRGIGALLKSPIFMLFLGAAALNQSSNTALYGFGTLRWHAAGLSGGVIGGFWVEMVAAEAIFFSFGHRIAAKIGPRWLLILGGAGGIVRWTVTAATVDPIWLASVQWMHCLTFTATHLGAMYFIQRSIPQELSGRAQALYSATATGLNFGLFLPLAGLLYEHIGSDNTFLAMALLSLGGLSLAVLLLRRWSGGTAIAPTAALA